MNGRRLRDFTAALEDSFLGRCSVLGVFTGIYKLGYKCPDMDYEYSYPTYCPGIR